MIIFIIKHETDIGPFFSSYNRALEHLVQSEDGADGSNMDAERLEAVKQGHDPYVSIVKAELDNMDTVLDC